MTTELTSSKMRMISPSCPSPSLPCLSAQSEDNIVEEESTGARDIEANRIESYAGRNICWTWMPSPNFVRKVHVSPVIIGA